MLPSEIMAVHLEVTDEVSYFEHMKSNRYFVWQIDGQTDLIADNMHIETAISGSTDLYTLNEFDEWKEAIEEQFNDYGFAWSFNSLQYEEETGFFHYEWIWEVV